jgi:lipoate synthase
LRREGETLGFLHVEAGPLVRSSYHAERHGPQDGSLTNLPRTVSSPGE